MSRIIEEGNTFEFLPSTQKTSLGEILDLNLSDFADELLSGQNESLYDSDSWSRPTKKIKENFNSWRKRSFNQENNFRTETANQEIEYKRLEHLIGALYQEQDDALFKGAKTDAYYTLAVMLGKIDYLKILFQGKEIKQPLTEDTTEKNKNVQQLPKPTVKAYVIKHVYLAKTGGQGITETNKSKLGKEYGYSPDKLRNEYRKLENDSNRLNLSQTKRSDSAHIKNFESALSLLKTKNPSAFNLAGKEFESLQKKFNNLYKK